MDINNWRAPESSICVHPIPFAYCFLRPIIANDKNPRCVCRSRLSHSNLWERWKTGMARYGQRVKDSVVARLLPPQSSTRATYRARQMIPRHGGEAGAARRQWHDTESIDDFGHAELGGDQTILLPSARERRQSLRGCVVPNPKYRSEFPATGFADLNAARDRAMRFVH